MFSRAADGLPVIERQADCQTCFMCEAWCPTDALFVAPQVAPVAADSPYRDEQWLTERDLLGSYRRELGWDKGRTGRTRPEREGLRSIAVQPLGLDNRRAAESALPQYEIGFNVGLAVAYDDEGEEGDAPEPAHTDWSA
jgi:ferredoxin